jgi:hypothetical protein
MIPFISSGTYLAGMCDGRFQEDAGNFSQHCIECRELGQCIGDCRQAHCLNCNQHYFVGLNGIACPCEERGGGDSDWRKFRIEET